MPLRCSAGHFSHAWRISAAFSPARPIVLVTPTGISAADAKRGAKHSQKIVVMKRMEGDMPKSVRFGDTKNSDLGEIYSRARHLDQGSKRACNYCLLRLYRGRIVGVSSMLL